MKTLLRLLEAGMALLALLLTTACSDSGKEPEGPSTPSEEVTPGQSASYTVLNHAQYTRAQLIDRALSMMDAQLGDNALSQYKTLLGYALPDGCTYHEVGLRYSSVDHRGRPIDLSGILSYRTGAKGADIDRIIIDSHATITDNASCPTMAGSVGQMAMLNSASAVVAADYQGYGISVSALHPYLNAPLTARQQVDMLKAAVDYLTDNASSISQSAGLAAYSVGYSQGGAVALSVHRLLESEEPELAARIGFKGSVCGDGPYSLTRTLAAYTEQGYVSLPVILPMIVRSMIECYPSMFEGLSVADYFTPELLGAGGDLMGLLDKKELNILAYNALLSSLSDGQGRYPLAALLNAEATDPDSRQMAALNAAFALNNCIKGWTPKAPVCFFHSRYDTVVPYDNLADTAEWPAGSYRITGPEREGIDHLAGAMLFYSDLLLRGPEAMLGK